MKNDIGNILRIKYPLLQGAMSRITNYELAGAVSEAGGLGVLTSVGLDGEALRNEIQKLREITEKPFGVNLMLQQSNVDEIVAVCVAEKVPVVTSGAGTPKKYIPALKEAGIKIIPVIASVYHAKKMEALGVDMVIAEGNEAGGHIGQTNSMALIPQVVDKVSIPVIGAGGVGDGRSLVAMKALGASGVQAGTLFLSAEECLIQDNYRKKLLEADDVATIVTGTKHGHPVRSLRNEMLEEYVCLESSGATHGELEAFTIGSNARAIFDDDMEKGSALAGQVAGLIHSVRPAREIIETLFREAEAVQQKLCE